MGEFNGFELWKFIKGRRRMVLTVVAFLLGLAISDSAVVATVSGGLVEAGFGLGEYFFKVK